MGVQGVGETLMIAGGGTGGHIYPAIAVAQEWIARNSMRRVIFVGTERGLETTIVPKAGFPLELISVGGLKGKGIGDTIKGLFRLPVGFAQAFALVGRYRPNVVFGVGGYSSGPVLMAARLRGMPTAIHESNAFPGLTNRVLARFVTATAVAFETAAQRMKRADAVLTGNPIREEFFSVRQPATGTHARKRVLIFGGSQGSRTINDAMIGALLFMAPLRDRIEIVHQTGLNELPKMQQAYRASAFADARVVPYLDPMVGEIVAADLIVSRSGAMTIGELAAVGRAAILIPLPATDNHQELNARAVEQAGGAMVITERELSPERLGLAITEIVTDPDRTERMGTAARTLAAPDATKKIVDLLEKIERSE